MNVRRRLVCTVPVLVAALCTTEAGAQEGSATSGGGTATHAVSTADASATQAPARDDMVLNPAQPDFTIVNLPTTLRLPAHRFAFRVTHRFFRDLGQGDFGDLLADFFGLDSAAQIGLELRFGVMPGWQAGIYRASDRTIEFFTQYSVLSQRDGVPLALDAWFSVEGTNNFAGNDPLQPTGEGQRSPALSAIVSHVFGRRGAVYAMPMWVHNTNPLPSEEVDHDSTFVVGLGGRLRVLPTVYVVVEVVPRLAGYDPGTTLAAFGIEKRVGGHSFQLNVSNGVGTTMGQVARGGIASDKWYLGFNISRKFF